MRSAGLGLFTVAFLIIVASVSTSPPACASQYSDALSAAAAKLDHAANTGAKVPFFHVPPPPTTGPPRYSPSVDDWLQAALSSARADRKLRDRKADLRQIAQALRYLALDERGAQPASRDVKATAQSVLANSAYRTAVTKAAPPPKPTIWDRILRWIVEQIGKLFEGLANLTQGVPVLGNIFAIALIGIAVLALVYVAYRLAAGFALRRRDATAYEGEELPARANVDTLRATALAAAREGNYARAVALLFQATLVLLDRSQRINYDPARTAGEYRRLVRRKAQFVAAEFDALARIFTAAAFAETPIDEGDWTLAMTAFATLGPPLGAQ